MIHTFSPNWYKPHCILLAGRHMFYASNYMLYKYNLDTRRVEADRCFRKIAMSHGMNSKDIKIHTIVRLNPEQLLVGLNQADAVVLDTDSLALLAVHKGIGVTSCLLCYPGRDGLA